jgi:hypothetical protein
MSGRKEEELSAVVLAGNAKIKRQLRRRRRRGVFYRISHPDMWKVERKKFESSLASKINKDDYIVGENKSLLYIHPDLISQGNINFLKRILYFAGKTGDRIYRRNKKDLLEYLSVKGITSISVVMRAVDSCRHIDNERTVVVGPKKQLSRELEREGLGRFHVLEQGNSIGENILIGKNYLEQNGFEGERMLVLGGDLPLITETNLSTFIAKAMDSSERPDISYGMGSRRELGNFIREHDLGSLGSVGPNHPKKGNLNKFGIPLVDDRKLFNRSPGKEYLMMGNMFIIRFDIVEKRFIDRFYSLRKMGANPFTYPYLLYKFGKPLLKAVSWKLKVSDAERSFMKATGIKIRISPVAPDLTLDLDSYTDLRRLSALYFHRLRTTHDLETDLKDFIKTKKRERKKAMKKGSGDG